ncbi:AMP-binding protein [Rhodococcus opacus]|uniref:AMP-binding protein n=1 Tax=Rhodococcus opacus TaxID=37919 RepID=UPI002949561B|nr:AMP-binding protein [Rhodococcus opacus]MDV6247196.1 AMP-binding protein [Rhodococcus opacus]
MQALGVEDGDRIGILSPNSAEFLQTWFASHLIGAIAVPINIAFRGDVLRHVLELSGCTVMVVHRDFVSRVSEARWSSLPASKTLVIIDDDGRPAESIETGPVMSCDSLSFDSPLTDVEIRASDVASIMFTSGTTGPSKGVVWTHGSTYHMSLVPGQSMGYGPDDVLYVCLPLFHASALVNLTVTGLMHGARVVLAERFSVQQFWPDVAKYGITATNILGAMGAILLSRAPDSLERDHKLRTAMVVPAPAGTAEVFRSRFGIEIVHPYGLSDFGWITWPSRGEYVPPGSIGKPHASVEVRIVDDLDNEVEIGRPGELIARPKLPWTTPNGYWRMPEQTLEAQRNLWFHTGDLARQDAAGWLYFVDRAKDAMRRRGENVTSYEVEQAFAKHPAVVECAAYGIRSPLSEDEIAVALVLRHTETKYSLADLINFVEPLLPYFAVPRYIRIVRELPKTATEKVRKGQLRDDGVTQDTWDAEAAGIRISR